LTAAGRVRAEIAALPGVLEDRSKFADKPAFWVNGKEIAHFDDDLVIDVRLTAPVIRSRRSELRERPEITLRRSSSADWLEVRIDNPEAERFAVELVAEAARAHSGHR
jgi:hypothetical protein